MANRQHENARDVAHYISTLTAELARMAAAEHLSVLARLLETACLEAEQLCGRDQRLWRMAANGRGAPSSGEQDPALTNGH